MINRLIEGLKKIVLVIAGVSFVVALDAFGSGYTKEGLQTGFLAIWCQLMFLMLRKVEEDETDVRNK